MLHTNCGGRMVKIQKKDTKIVYQCNRCGKIITVYSRIATGGSLKEVK